MRGGGGGDDRCGGVDAFDATVGGGGRADEVQVVVCSVGRDVVLGGQNGGGVGGERNKSSTG